MGGSAQATGSNFVNTCNSRTRSVSCTPPSPISFKVNSGEYKLMELAPYGRPVYADQIMASSSTCGRMAASG